MFRHDRREIPEWVDGAIRKAVHPVPDKRYAYVRACSAAASSSVNSRDRV